MNDDQMITLLRDVTLPGEPIDRYAAVQARGRRQDRRRTAVLAASLAVVVVAGGTTALTWKGKPAAQTFLKDTADARTARVSLHVGGETDGDLAFDGATGVVDFEHSAMQLSFGSGKKRAELRSIGDDMWISGSQISEVSSGKTWVHFPRSFAGQSFGFFDPSRTMAELEKAHATFAKKGQTRIDGVPVTEYAVSVPSQGSDKTALGGTDKGEVYVDGDGLVRRLAADDGGFEMDFTDFGTPVHVVAPPKDDVMEFGDTPFSTGTSSSTTVTGSQTLTPGQTDAATKARLCQQVKAAIGQDTRIPQAKRDELVKQVCGK